MCKLNEKFKEWKEWYSDGSNSICAQISSMLWNAAVFYTINVARKYATDSKGNLELNEMVHNFIDRSFLATQTLSIRNLYDKRDDVISLRRLIDDMKKNKALITRENILSALELPDDHEKAINEGQHSDSVHKNIDLLAGVDSGQRQPNDTIQDDMFDKLNKHLDECQPIVDFVNKTVAHVATKKSKGKVPAKNLKISLARIHKAHCRIVKVAAFIGQVILYKSLAYDNFLLPRAGDEFDHFGKPFVRQEDIEKLEDVWSHYAEHIKQLSERPERRII